VTDPELIAKKLALIETCVRELRSLGEPETNRALFDLDDLLSFVAAMRRL
jgi:hypothetical protein